MYVYHIIYFQLFNYSHCQRLALYLHSTILTQITYTVQKDDKPVYTTTRNTKIPTTEDISKAFDRVQNINRVYNNTQNIAMSNRFHISLTSRIELASQTGMSTLRSIQSKWQSYARGKD